MNPGRLAGPFRGALPAGTLKIGAGIAVSGLGTYFFLAISARTLGADRYAALSALWALVFFVAPGFFFPLEQEIGRLIAARGVAGLGSAPIFRRAVVTGALIASILTVGALIASPWMVKQLFDGQTLLLVGFILAVLAYLMAHICNGVLAGTGRFELYGAARIAESVVRVAIAIALALLATKQAGMFALAIAIAPLAVVCIALPSLRRLEAGPPLTWSEFSGRFLYLVVATALSALLVNGGLLILKVLASGADKSLVSKFLVGQTVTRVPLFLFQSVQVSLLPSLSRSAAEGNQAHFNQTLFRLLRFILLSGTLTILGAVVLGPYIIKLFFGSSFVLGGRHLGYLAASAIALMVATTFAQALIAREQHRRAAAAWLLGVVVLAATSAIPLDLLTRIEFGLLLGTTLAALAMLVALVVKPRVWADVAMPVVTPPSGDV